MLADLLTIGLMAATGLYGALADRAHRTAKGAFHGRESKTADSLIRAWNLEARHD